jgi:hypothetical protein
MIDLSRLRYSLEVRQLRHRRSCKERLIPFYLESMPRHECGGPQGSGDAQCQIGSTNCLTETCRKSSAKGTPPAVVRQSRNSTPMIVSSMCPRVFVGHDALDKFAGGLRATHPHFVYTPHGEPQALHNAGRLAWGSGARGEKPDYTGLDVIIVRGDKIAALYVFLDPIPS